MTGMCDLSPAHPPDGPQLAERLGPFAGVVGGQPGRLPDERHPGRPGPGEAGVFQGELGVLVDEPSGRDQVPADELGGRLGEAAQLAAGLGVEVGVLDVVGKFGLTLIQPRRGLPVVVTNPPDGLHVTGLRHSCRWLALGRFNRRPGLLGRADRLG